MAETKQIILKVDVQGNKELERLQANFDGTRRAIAANEKAEKQGTITAERANAVRARAKLDLMANSAALSDHRRALLKNNDALRKNSGFVAGVRKGVGQWATSMIGVTVAIAAVSKLVGSAVQIFKDFEQANSKLAAVTRATTEEMKVMSDQAKALGSSTAFTASQVTGLQIEFAKLGFPTGDILQMTEATLAGAAALGSELAEQAALTGALLKQYGLDASEAGRVNDVLAESAASSALDFSKLSTALPIVGATANAVGVSLEKTTALLGNLSDRGLDASTSGTSLRNVFLELSKQGLTFEEAMAKINGSTDKAKTSMQLFGKRGATAGLILAETGIEVADLEEKLISADGAAERMAETMLDNLAGDLTIAKSAWEGFILSLEDGQGVFSKVARAYTTGVTQMLQVATNLNEGLSISDSFKKVRLEAEGLTHAAKRLSEAPFFAALEEKEVELNIERIAAITSGVDQTSKSFILLEKKIALVKEKLGELPKGEDVLAAGGGGGKDEGDGGSGSGLTKAQIAAIEREKQKDEKIADNKKKIEKKAIEDAQKFKNEKFDEFFESDRERAISAIEAEFQDKINAITTNGQRETDLVLQLNALKKIAVDEQEAIFLAEDEELAKEQLTLKKELELEVETIEAEGDLQRLNEILERKRALELSNENLTAGEKAVIQAKFNAEISANEERLKQAKIDNNRDIAASAANLAGTLSSLAKEGSDEAKGFAIVQAGINGALAITQALAQLGPIAGAIASVGIGIATAAQIAKISGATFERGGVLEGARHSEGGIPFTIDGQAGFEAEGGEAIMTRNAVKMFGAELSAMNVAGGGVAFKRGGIARKFASGGALPSSSGVTSSQQRSSIETGMAQFAEDIVQGINDKEVINVSTNTNEVANEVNNIAAEATF